jgi:hypothetical protein
MTPGYGALTSGWMAVPWSNVGGTSRSVLNLLNLIYWICWTAEQRYWIGVWIDEVGSWEWGLDNTFGSHQSADVLKQGSHGKNERVEDLSWGLRHPST